MSIIASPRHGTKPGLTPTERPRAVAPARLGGRPGVSREVLRDLNVAAQREQQSLAALPSPRPWTALLSACGATHAACVFADAILDDLSDLAESWIDLLEPHVAAGVDHAVRMLLLPVAALLAEPLDGGAYSTWDHREIGKPVGRELGTDDTGTEATV